MVADTRYTETKYNPGISHTNSPRVCNPESLLIPNAVVTVGKRTIPPTDCSVAHADTATETKRQNYILQSLQKDMDRETKRKNLKQYKRQTYNFK